MAKETVRGSAHQILPLKTQTSLGERTTMSSVGTADSKSVEDNTDDTILLRPYPARRTPSQHRVCATTELVNACLRQNLDAPIEDLVTLISSRYISDTKALFVISSGLDENRNYDVFNVICTYDPQRDTTHTRWIGYTDENAQQKWLQRSKIAFLLHDRDSIRNLIPKRRKEQIDVHLSSLNGGVKDIILSYCGAPVKVFTHSKGGQKVGLMRTIDFAGSYVHQLTKRRYLKNVTEGLSWV